LSLIIEDLMRAEQLKLFSSPVETCTKENLQEELRSFSDFGRHTLETVVEVTVADGSTIVMPAFMNEFWTARQRDAHSLHEVSYRACFKAQLPAFFISRLTKPGDSVYDPFMGRGTTVLEAALHGRRPLGCDINPLSMVMIKPRLSPPSLTSVEERLKSINLGAFEDYPEKLLVFYHPVTLREICALKNYFMQRDHEGGLDGVDDWIRMVALNRLTGHSPGFFSVYTMPPNQAVSLESQRRINERRHQVPPRRDVVKLIITKTESLLRDVERLRPAQHLSPLILTADAAHTPEITDQAVHLVVTSPPFLDIVDYALDNWLRCWFIGMDAQEVPMSIFRKLGEWELKMTGVFCELRRLLVPGGYVAFEVGEVRKGTIRLEEAVIRAALNAALEPVLLIINSQKFTKTAQCWGVDNNAGGTNTNRIVLLRRPGNRH
jgi:hypothetical protein